MKKVWLVGLAAALTFALVAAPAQAHTKRVDTQVTIEDFDYDPSTDTVTFFGQVNCPRPRCERNRRVRLRQLDTGQLAGTDRSDASGDWVIRFQGSDVPPGRFQAKALRKVFRHRHRNGTRGRTICKRDSSPVFNPF